MKHAAPPPIRHSAVSGTARKRRTSLLAAATLALGLAGCSVLPQRPPPHALTAYRITLPSPSQTKTAAACPSVRVAMPTAAAGFGGPSMRYSESPGTVASFAFHRWAAPPARMFEPLLIRSLSDSGLFQSVLAADAPAAAPLQLDTQLVTLLQRVSGTQSQVHLVVRASLSDLRSHRQLSARRFAVDTPADAATPAAGARATDVAVAQMTHELIGWLDGLAHSDQCSPGH
ncbi:ABC-type transport auxiliary lipoprotein family protein [Acidihalobacter prosperus]